MENQIDTKAVKARIAVIFKDSIENRNGRFNLGCQHRRGSALSSFIACIRVLLAAGDYAEVNRVLSRKIAKSNMLRSIVQAAVKANAFGLSDAAITALNETV